mmetsp:Transcript_9024/g.19714  ORF Transcript_9024/g.19714 Transcript_9024/m.19714 type:complete len:254 (+) Transcript_9024:733-1494(+)
MVQVLFQLLLCHYRLPQDEELLVLQTEGAKLLPVHVVQMLLQSGQPALPGLPAAALLWALVPVVQVQQLLSVGLVSKEALEGVVVPDPCPCRHPVDNFERIKRLRLRRHHSHLHIPLTLQAPLVLMQSPERQGALRAGQGVVARRDEPELGLSAAHGAQGAVVSQPGSGRDRGAGRLAGGRGGGGLRGLGVCGAGAGQICGPDVRPSLLLPLRLLDSLQRGQRPRDHLCLLHRPLCLGPFGPHQGSPLLALPR